MAIWVGDFVDEAEADDYLVFEFGYDFEAFPEEANLPELSVVSNPVPVKELLAPCSSSAGFIDAAANRAREMSLTEATTAVVYYFTHFDDRGFTPPDARLVFLGNFEA